MSKDQTLLQCYNRGCGKQYSPDENGEESCRHHPGAPVFHDAYKGWSCCNKKCTDFTEFLNIKGCTLSKHSNVKPPEPEAAKKQTLVDEVIEVKAPVQTRLPRPPLDTTMTILKPQVAPSLRQQLQVITQEKQDDSDEIPIGMTCKNSGCNTAYEGPNSLDSVCTYHPGAPIFHEGMKFWSCCQKRTTDFNAFLNQIGCEQGKHQWKNDSTSTKSIQCRWDHHQTATHVIVSVYAKKYCPDNSVVKINPIRLYVSLVFPENGNAAFELDVELMGIVDVDRSDVSMYGTKAEIRLKKAEPGHWTKLVARKLNEQPAKIQCKDTDKNEPVNTITSQVEDVDLSDL